MSTPQRDTASSLKSAKTTLKHFKVYLKSFGPYSDLGDDSTTTIEEAIESFQNLSVEDFALNVGQSVSGNLLVLMNDDSQVYNMLHHFLLHLFYSKKSTATPAAALNEPDENDSLSCPTNPFFAVDTLLKYFSCMKAFINKHVRNSQLDDVKTNKIRDAVVSSVQARERRIGVSSLSKGAPPMMRRDKMSLIRYAYAHGNDPYIFKDVAITEYNYKMIARCSDSELVQKKQLSVVDPALCVAFTRPKTEMFQRLALLNSLLWEEDPTFHLAISSLLSNIASKYLWSHIAPI